MELLHLQTLTLTVSIYLNYIKITYMHEQQEEGNMYELYLTVLLLMNHLKRTGERVIGRQKYSVGLNYHIRYFLNNYILVVSLLQFLVVSLQFT